MVKEWNPEENRAPKCVSRLDENQGNQDQPGDADVQSPPLDRAGFRALRGAHPSQAMISQSDGEEGLENFGARSAKIIPPKGAEERGPNEEDHTGGSLCIQTGQAIKINRGQKHKDQVVEVQDEEAKPICRVGFGRQIGKLRVDEFLNPQARRVNHRVEGAPDGKPPAFFYVLEEVFASFAWIFKPRGDFGGDPEVSGLQQGNRVAADRD